MSLNGLIAMSVGIVFTAGLAIALMALVFHSNRSGRDAEVDRFERRDR